MLGAKDSAASEPVVVHDYQTAQDWRSLSVGTPNVEINLLYDTRSSSLWVPNTRLRWFSFHTFYHESRSSIYVANGGKIKIEYGSGPVSEDTVSIEGVSIADYTFAEMTNVSGLENSLSLGRNHLTESAAWLVFHFHPFCRRSSYSSGKSGRCWRGARLCLLP